MNTAFPNPVVFAIRKSCKAADLGEKKTSIYAVSDTLGISEHTAQNCAVLDAQLMREIFASEKLSQAELKKELLYKPVSPWEEHNKRILENYEINYYYAPNSKVFHTKDCPCIQNMSKIMGLTTGYYAAQKEGFQPCKRCNPNPITNHGDDQSVHKTEPEAEKVEIDYDEYIQVKMLGGTLKLLSRRQVVGTCHNLTHPGKMTKEVMKKHECLKKECPFFKREPGPYWDRIDQEAKEKAKRKEAKKQQKALKSIQAQSMAEIKTSVQSLANAAHADIDIIKVEHPDFNSYLVYYVSDVSQWDKNRYPAFSDALRKYFHGCYVGFQRIKDENGKYVTRKEYYARTGRK